jgi:hypothetical protein
MSIDDGLGFRERGVLVILSTDKHRRRQDLPQIGPSVGGKDILLLVWFQLMMKGIDYLDIYGGVDVILP